MTYTKLSVEAGVLEGYVDRISLVNYFQTCLSNIQYGGAFPHFIEWTGAPGIGKTSLV